jgi:hypothetical protein
VAELTATGYTVVAESWGARLRLADDFDRGRYERHLAAARAGGYLVAEVDSSAARDFFRLQAAVHDDYPRTPATPSKDWTLAEVEALWDSGWRVFGAWDAGGELVAVTRVRQQGSRVETEETAGARAHRRRGLGVAVKSASILALAEAGGREFATGGAAVNAGSIAMNRATGYELTERWLSFAPPPKLPETGE